MKGGGMQVNEGHYAFSLLCIIYSSFFKILAGILVHLIEAADGW